MIFISFWFSILGALSIRMKDFSSGDEFRNLSIIICERIPIRTYFSSNVFFEAIGRIPIICARKRDASLPKL